MVIRHTEPPTRYLVVPFENAGRIGTLHWLEEASAVLVADDVIAFGGQALTRDERMRAFERLNVPTTATLSHATVIRLGQLVGATHVIEGRFDVRDARLSVTLRTTRLDTGRLLPELTEQGALDDAFTVYARVAQRLLDAHAMPIGRALQGHPTLAAFEQFIKGLIATTPATQLAHLEQAAALAPVFHRVRLAEWEAHDQQGQHEAALEAVRRVPFDAPESRRAQFLAGLSLYNLGRDEEAQSAFTVLSRTKPDVGVLTDLGAVQLRRGLPAAGVVSLFKQAVALDPEDPDLFFNLGYAALLAQDRQAAIAALRDGVRRNPADHEAHYLLGLALQAAGSTTEAARERELARQLSSTAVAWEKAGNVVPKGLARLRTEIDVPATRRLDGTLVSTNQREQRELAAFHLDRARRLVQQEQDVEATSELRRVIYLSPYESEAHRLLGRVHLRAGRTADAVDAFKIALWSEDTVAARLGLAESLLAAQEPAAAKAQIDVVLQREPANAEARRLAARLP